MTESEEPEDELASGDQEAPEPSDQSAPPSIPKFDIAKIAGTSTFLDAITKANAGLPKSILNSAGFKAATGDLYKNLGVLNSDIAKGILGSHGGIAGSLASSGAFDAISKLGAISVPTSALDAITKAGLPEVTGMSAAMKALYPDGFASFANIPKLDQSIATSMLPAIAANATWSRHLAGINADILKAARLPQTEMGFLTNFLAKNANFGLGKGLDSYLKQFAASQSKWMAGIAPLLSGLKDFRPYPENLSDIAELRISEVQAVVMLDGIGLYGVPRADIAEALIRADDSAKRRKIMGRRWQHIVADCREALDGCVTDPYGPEVEHTLAAIDALEAGHAKAAQALIGSVLDTLVNGYFGDGRKEFTPNSRTKDSNAYKNMHVREYIAFAPVWQAYQQFFPVKGDPVPRTFSRHATAHTTSKQQYSRVNAVQGLMIVCGILLFLDEEIAKQQAA